MLYNLERPHDFDSMVGQKKVVENIRIQSREDRWFQVYLLSGQFGSGKTTMARIIALAANCRHKDDDGNPCLQCSDCRSILADSCPDVIEMDGASNTGVDHVRQLREQVSYLPAVLQKKVYIIDEAHMLSTGAFNALLKVLEEPPEHVLFILCTTEIKKIPATVRSRAAKYHFSQICEMEMKEHLLSVARKNGIEVEEPGIRLICKNSDGSMRNALSLLDQAGKEGCVSEENVASLLGVTDSKSLFLLLTYLINNDRDKVLEMVERFLEGGRDALLVVSELLDICADVLVSKNGADSMVKGTDTYVSLLSQVAAHVECSDILSLIDGLLDLRDAMRKSPGRTTFICGMIRLMMEDGSMIKEIDRLSERVSLLEKGMASGVNGCDAANPSREEMPKDDSAGKMGQAGAVSDQPEKGVASFDSYSMFFLPDASANISAGLDQDERNPEEAIDSICRKEPVLVNTLRACHKMIEDGRVVYVTTAVAIYQVLEQAEKRVGKFPFAYRLEA